jgi:hypothetical protein
MIYRHLLQKFCHVKAVFTLAEFIMIMSATATSDKQATLTIVLALATFGCVTQIGLFLFLVASPKVAKARTYSVTVADVFTKNYITNVNDP